MFTFLNKNRWKAKQLKKVLDNKSVDEKNINIESHWFTESTTIEGGETLKARNDIIIIQFFFSSSFCKKFPFVIPTKKREKKKEEKNEQKHEKEGLNI